jgi:hypothetical protein
MKFAGRSVLVRRVSFKALSAMDQSRSRLPIADQWSGRRAGRPRGREADGRLFEGLESLGKIYRAAMHLTGSFIESNLKIPLNVVQRLSKRSERSSNGSNFRRRPEHPLFSS